MTWTVSFKVICPFVKHFDPILLKCTSDDQLLFIDYCFFKLLLFLLKIPDLKEVILIGFYQSSEPLSKFIASAQQEFGIAIRYVQLTS